MTVTLDRRANFPVPALVCSTNNRPDVLASIKKGRNADLIPLLCIEVHSGDSYADSVTKTIADCIDQLGVLRNIDNTVTVVHGFTFPKPSDPFFVTKVIVRWHEWRFKVSLTKLPQQEVGNALTQAMSQNRAIVNRLRGEMPTHLTILPLSPDDLQEIEAKMGAAKQPQSFRTTQS